MPTTTRFDPRVPFSQGSPEDWIVFAPGSNGSLSWNTTLEIAGRPLLVYLYDPRAVDGVWHKASRQLERQALTDPRIVGLSERFVCEKVSLDDSELLTPSKAARPLDVLIRETRSVPRDERRPVIALLDSEGTILQRLDAGVGAEKLFRAMRRVLSARR